MIKRIIIMCLFTVIASCKSTSDKPNYNSELLEVGYVKSFQYWTPVRKVTNHSKQSKKIMDKIRGNGITVLIYEYSIDSDGYVWDIKLIETMPKDIINQKELILSKHVDNKFRVTDNNSERKPIKVTARMVFQPNNEIAIPSDDTSITEFLNILIKNKQRSLSKGNS